MNEHPTDPATLPEPPKPLTIEEIDDAIGDAIVESVLRKLNGPYEDDPDDGPLSPEEIADIEARCEKARQRYAAEGLL
ncbi:hypothetical protein AB4120_03725 [Cupriavidus sp. 2KB_3]|uniref:hypothetical protein n=1 Tax=Cupriavidus TaxID=106589 RepID=UPI0011EC96DD|nr:hypothetical protein [Cupriavidus campinensis]